MRLKSVFTLLLFAFVISSAYAVQFEDTGHPLSLGKHFQFLEDKQGILSIVDVAAGHLSGGFTDNPANILNLGFSDSVYWIRFKVKNKLSTDEKLLLEIGFPQLEHITLFIPKDDGTYLEKKAGYTIPFENRDIKYHNFIFELLPFEENTFYVRVKFQFAAQIFLNLWTHPAFAEYIAKERLLIGLLYGVMLSMILYNLSIFVFTRDFSYAYYVGFISCVTILLLIMNGLIHYVLPFQTASWLTHHLTIWIGIDVLLGALFIEKVLGVRENAPRFSRVLHILGLSGVFVALFSIFNAGLVSVILTFFVAIIGSGIVFFGIVLGCLKKLRIAYISMIAFLPIIISNVVAAMGFYGLIRVNLFSNNVILMGTSLSAIIFSVGLADFINQIRREREQYASELKIKNRTLLEVISEREKAAEALFSYKAQLEQLVKDRTAELESSNRSLVQEIDDRKKMEVQRTRLEEQLRQAKKMEAIGTLAGGIAHDFNNILATMLGYTELLIDRFADPSDEYEYLNEIYQAGRRAADLVSQILTFSRAGGLELKSIPPVPLLNKIINMVRATLPSTIEIQKQTNVRESIRIMANETQIHQVILNLCNNAAHAMQEKGGILEFKLSEVKYIKNQQQAPMLTAGSYFKLSIRDTGHGIPNPPSKLFIRLRL